MSHQGLIAEGMSVQQLLPSLETPGSHRWLGLGHSQGHPCHQDHFKYPSNSDTAPAWPPHPSAWDTTGASLGMGPKCWPWGHGRMEGSMHDAISCHPHLPLSHIRHSLEQDLSKCESTQNQTALPGWASPDREGGLGGKQQRGDPRALEGPRTFLSVGMSTA